MKWILICVAAIIVCFGIGFVLSRLIVHKTKKRSVLKVSLFTVVFSLVFSIICTFAFLGINYKPKEDALKALKGSDEVKVSEIKKGYYFDGPSSDTALIFYPGAKVKCEAYAPIMLELAKNGIDCFLADMPFNFAIFGENTCESFLDSYNYQNWILSGHSMGGLVCSNYTSKHPNKIKGLVLLASYPSKQIENSVNLLSIYGSEDGCLEKDTYEKDKVNWPTNSKEFVIEGANHAQFGDYGFQSGDGKASITKEKQWQITVSTIIDWKATW